MKVRIIRTLVVPLTIVTVAFAGSPTVAAEEPSTQSATAPLPTIDPTSTLVGTLAKAHPARRNAAVSAVPADLSRDGKPDLLTALGSALNVHVGTGAPDGAGAFTTSVHVADLAVNRTWIGQGDLDADGDNDVASIAGDGGLFFAPHSGTFDGERTLQPEYFFSSGWQAASLTTFADFVGHDTNNPTTLDGLADIIFRYSGDNAIYLYVNEGLENGRPRFTNRGKLFNQAQAVTSINVADVTGDEFPDFYMTFNNGSAWLYDVFAEQDANGNWVAKWYTVQSSGVQTSEIRRLLDVNNDGFPDLVIRKVNASGDLAVRFHNRNWDPAAPSQVFNVASERVLATGWLQYRLVA